MKAVTDKPEIIKATVRIEKSLWDAVRILAVKENTTAEAIVTLAVKETLKEFLKIGKRKYRSKGGK